MALQKTITKVVYGDTTTFTDAYHQVVEVHGDKKLLNVYVIIYKDVKKQIKLDDFYFTFTPNVSTNSTNFIEQAYGQLKVLDKYDGAIDC